MPPSLPSTPEGLELHKARRAIVVVDMVESVRLMQEHEDDVIDRWRRFVREVRAEVLPAHGGRMVKSLGDGMLLEFGSAAQAASAALQVQRRVLSYNTGREASACLHLRLGGHVCDVVVDQDDIYGVGVNLAARLASVGGAGEIIVSPEFREMLVPGLDADVEDLGPVYVKHMAQPLHAMRMMSAPSDGSSASPTRLPADAASMLPTLAVMPLRNRGELPSGSALGDLVVDGLCERLCRCHALKVISRLSSAALAQRDLDAPALGRLLGCDFILHGSCLDAGGGGILVLVELADTRSNTTVWSGRVRTTLAELLEPDDPATAQLAEAVVQAVVDSELKRTRTLPLPSLQSFSLHLAAVSMMHRSPVDDFLRAGPMFEQLIDRHPRAPQPRALLAQWHVTGVTRGLSTDLAAEGRRALDHTAHALDADPTCSLALAMEGFVHCHIGKNMALAQQRLTQALEANPSEPLAWLFQCVVQGFVDQGEQAWVSAQRALALSPLDPMRHYFDGLAASAAVAASRWEDAVALAQRSLRVNRNHLPTLRALAVAGVNANQHAVARHAAARVLELDPSFTVARYLAAAAPGSESTRKRYAKALLEAGLPRG